MLTVFTPVLLLFVLVSQIWDPFRWGMYFNAWRDMSPVLFYGRVVDDTGAPVAKAEISLRITVVNWAFILGEDAVRKQPKFSLTTDENGRFEVKNTRGAAISVDMVRKPGYTYRFEDNRNSSFYFYQGTPIHHADREKPVDFVVQHSAKDVKRPPKR